jgi:hypothetical protein
VVDLRKEQEFTCVRKVASGRKNLLKLQPFVEDTWKDFADRAISPRLSLARGDKGDNGGLSRKEVGYLVIRSKILRCLKLQFLL